MKSFKQILSEASGFKHPYNVKPVSKRVPEAKEALIHADLRVHHLRMMEWYQDKKDAQHLVDVHSKAMSSHSSVEKHILNDIYEKSPEMFSGAPEKPKKFNSTKEAKIAAFKDSNEALKLSKEYDGGKLYKGPHEKYKNGYK